MDAGSDRDRRALDHQSRVRILGGPAHQPKSDLKSIGFFYRWVPKSPTLRRFDSHSDSHSLQAARWPEAENLDLVVGSNRWAS